MVAKTLSVQKIVPYLKHCGYRDEFVQENYAYYSANENKQKNVELVAFHRPAYNSNTACIAVLDGNKFPEQQIGSLVSSHLSLGSPAILVFRNDNLQFWYFDGTDAVFNEETKAEKLDKFFNKYTTLFSPDSIFRAKTIGRVNKSYQLSFVDVELMPIIEKKEGEYLSGLIVRINEALEKYRNNLPKTAEYEKWLFQAGFWLIGAKILKDKGVESFKTLDVSNIDDLIAKVKRHYNADTCPDISKKNQKLALTKVAEEIVKPVSSLAHITTESLAYVYENALVTKETRKALGTHATPSWLVHYIVWQVADWISGIPQEHRIIFEPACGHAPFLTAGAMLLNMLYEGKEEHRHKYLKDHLIGIEKDPFAREIARLALTLADIPNKNGWRIFNKDIYSTDILSETAKNSMMFFCNPPFEDFKEEKKNYTGLRTNNKATEVLTKVLYNLPEKAVFGVILPQGFLHKENLAGLRKYILDNFELRTICNLPENGVFGKSEHPATVLIGRKAKSEKDISYIRVHKSHLEIFKNTYQAEEETVSKNGFYMAEDISFRFLELKEIWNYCKEYPEFQKFAIVGRGIEYKGGLNIEERRNLKKFSDAEQGFYSYDENTLIEHLPKLFWLNTSKQAVNSYASGIIHEPYILLNRIRSGRAPWRLRAFIDPNGHPCAKTFLTVVGSNEISLYILWAILNSPLANAYVHDHCMHKDNNEGVIKSIPVPFEGQDLSKLEALVKRYFEFDRAEFALTDEEKFKRDKRQCLLEIDAEVLRLYDLPPRLEKKLLNFFAGYSRKGVDFKFDRYYEEGFGSNIPLYMYISKEFQNSTVENVMKWVEENRTPGVIEAFKKAKEDFEGE